MALDHLLRGDVARCGDTLIQRFKSVETAASEGSWRVASRLELIPEASVSSVTPAEREAAATLELREAKLRDLLAKEAGSREGPWPKMRAAPGDVRSPSPKP